MIDVNKTVSIKKGNKTYVNDVDRNRIYVIDKNGDVEEELPFVITFISKDKEVFIKKGLDVLVLDNTSKKITKIIKPFVEYNKPKKTVKKLPKTD